MDPINVKNWIWLAVIVASIFLLRLIGGRKKETIIRDLVAGIILGNLAIVGIDYFEPMKHSSLLFALSEIAISFFLFRIGFTTSVDKMREVGFRAGVVALVGVGTTFVLGLCFIPFVIPGLTVISYVFIATALTTTSVGITAGILKELGMLETRTADVILGAAVIDDVMSLIILSMITTWLDSGLGGIYSIDLGIFKILLFVALGIGIGQIAARIIPSLFYRAYRHVNSKILAALSFFVCFFLGSKAIGFSPIVGSFIGGLVLEEKHFNALGQELHGKHVESAIEWLSSRTVPIFFIMTGMQMDISTLFSLQTILIAIGLTVIAVAGKLACGFFADGGVNRSLVGLGMVPRGEVGLVFASVGLMSGVISGTIFSAIIIVVAITTLLAPIAMRKISRRSTGFA